MFLTRSTQNLLAVPPLPQARPRPAQGLTRTPRPRSRPRLDAGAIQLISRTMSSPEARGRSERMFSSPAVASLPCELRLAGITDMSGADLASPKEVFLPQHNARFGGPRRVLVPGHRLRPLHRRDQSTSCASTFGHALSCTATRMRYWLLPLQIFAGRHRRHYEQGQGRAGSEYPDGTMAVFRRCRRSLARYHAGGQRIDSHNPWARRVTRSIATRPAAQWTSLTASLRARPQPR